MIASNHTDHCNTDLIRMLYFTSCFYRQCFVNFCMKWWTRDDIEMIFHWNSLLWQSHSSVIVNRNRQMPKYAQLTVILAYYVKVLGVNNVWEHRHFVFVPTVRFFSSPLTVKTSHHYSSNVNDSSLTITRVCFLPTPPLTFSLYHTLSLSDFPLILSSLSFLRYFWFL